MKTAELTGALLDYWVARAVGWRFWREKRGQFELCVYQGPNAHEPYKNYRNIEAEKHRYVELHSFTDLHIGFFGDGVPKFSKDWFQGGPIIEREKITINDDPRSKGWRAGQVIWLPDHDDWQYGPTPLVAAMRVYVASKFGNTIPDDGD